jgi:hypothetical protein
VGRSAQLPPQKPTTRHSDQQRRNKDSRRKPGPPLRHSRTAEQIDSHCNHHDPDEPLDKTIWVRAATPPEFCSATPKSLEQPTWRGDFRPARQQSDGRLCRTATTSEPAECAGVIPELEAKGVQLVGFRLPFLTWIALWTEVSAKGGTVLDHSARADRGVRGAFERGVSRQTRQSVRLPHEASRTQQPTRTGARGNKSVTPGLPMARRARPEARLPRPSLRAADAGQRHAGDKPGSSRPRPSPTRSRTAVSIKLRATELRRCRARWRRPPQSPS